MSLSVACRGEPSPAATPPGLRERQGGRAVRGGRPATPRGVDFNRISKAWENTKEPARGPAQTVMGVEDTLNCLLDEEAGDLVDVEHCKRTVKWKAHTEWGAMSID